MTDRITLSNVKPDYESISEQLLSALKKKESWQSLNNSSTMRIVVEAIAAVGESSQYSVMSATQETTLENAKIPESIYTNSRFLGVRISRKVPAQVTANLQNTNYVNQYLEIPKYTQFTINGESYFNRTAIIFNNSSSIISTTLYQGQIKQVSYTSDGSNYQTYNLVEEPWTVSDSDIICYVDNIEFNRSSIPIFAMSSTDTLFYENSLPSGIVECKFGNGIYGVVPNSQSNILFKYAVTKGSEANNSQSSLPVTATKFPTLVGETTSNAYNGSDEKSLKFYQEMGSMAGASNGRGIDRDDYRALVIQYPGVIDCKVYGQAEIAPNDKDYMNVIGLMLLVDDSFTSDSWKNLVKYLKQNGIFTFQFKRFIPTAINVDINISLYLNTGSSLSQCRDTVISKIQEYTALDVGSLGKSLYISDIDNIVLSSIPKQIDYIERASPVIDYVITDNQYIKINSITVNTYYSNRSQSSTV
jgi:hypothetical protein